MDISKVNNGKRKMNRARRSELIFYIAIVFVPTINYFLFKVYKEYLDAVLFCFKVYDYDHTRYVFTTDIFVNFRAVWAEMMSSYGWEIAFKNSVVLYVVGWLTMPIGMLVPYYIVKKLPGTKVFKVILMLPRIIPTIVWVMIYKNLVDKALPEYFHWQYGLLSNVDSRFWTIWTYGFFMGFGGSMLLYTGIYSGVPEGTIEAGLIDGLGDLGLMIHVYFPKLYPVWSVSIFTGISGIFTSNITTDWFGTVNKPEISTIGSILFNKVMSGSGDSFANYSFNAAANLMFTCVVLPITLGGKYIVEHIGPTEDERVRKVKKGRVKA